MNSTEQRLQSYIGSGWSSVIGWLDRYSARVIADLTQIQREHAVTGAFGEIGVHHGKLFILMRLAAPDDRGFAIDVFEDQHLNVDRSGAGDRRKFLDNVTRWTGSIEGIAVIQQSSLEVSPEFLLREVGLCRMISVDGGHTEQCTLNDLKLCDAVLRDGGVAIIDDCFDEGWPDVATGVARYCLDSSTRLRPFAISPGKVYFTQPNHHAFYAARLRSLHERNIRRINRMFGHEVVIFRLPQVPPLHQRLARRLRRTLARYRASGSGRTWI